MISIVSGITRFKMIFYFILSLVIVSEALTSTVHFQPQQIHLALGEDVSHMIVTWSTKTPTNASIVDYGIGNLDKRATGSSYLFVDGGKDRRSQHIHRVTLPNLQAGEIYYYRCGSELGWSSIYYFRGASKLSNTTLRFAVFGDMGNKNAQSLPRLQQESQMGIYDAIIHVGDFAYDLHSDNGRVGDEFMKQIEPIAAYVPYMTCPGNHEKAYNFSHYRARFSMPELPHRMFYSFNIGAVHFISINTEVYFNIIDDLKNGIKNLIFQYKWLEKDLQEANKPENREKHPWIITYGHKPMYSSSIYDTDSTHEDAIVRVGLPETRSWGLEKLFFNYGVDLEIWGHMHSYERLWPVYDGKVYNGSNDEPYTNPKAPVHITTGSAGAEGHDASFIQNPSSWSAFRAVDYGFTRLNIYNKSHLYFEQVSIDRGGEIIDRTWLIKDVHKSYQ